MSKDRHNNKTTPRVITNNNSTATELKENRLDKPLSKSSRRVVGIIVGLIFMFMIVGAVSGGGQDEGASTNSSSISKSDAETVCQEHINNYDLLNRAGFNKKYINLIDVWNYNSKMYKHIAGNNEFGNSVHLINWNGINTFNDSVVNFSCYLSRSDTGYLIHWISANGVDLAGSAAFKAYDDDGNLIQ